MTSFQNDTLTFYVVYRDSSGFMRRDVHSTFASAAGQAHAMDGFIRSIEAKFDNGSSSWSGSMYVLNKNNEQRVVNKYFCKHVIDFLRKS